MGLFSKQYPFQYKVEVFDMRCGMCEMHVEDVIRKNFNIRKVKASHLKKEAMIYADEELALEEIKKAIAATGYRVGEAQRIVR